jgi:hypothetical protein
LTDFRRPNITSFADNPGFVTMASTTHIDTGAAMPDAVPDITVSVRQMFGIDIDMQVPAFSKPN